MTGHDLGVISNWSLIQNRVARPVQRLSLRGFCLLLVSLGAGQSQADEVTEWLDRMGTALREQNYRGTFTYMRGAQLETIRIVHQFVEGDERERLTAQNGEYREVVRDGGKVICYHADGDDAALDHNVPLGPFSAAFNERLASYQQLYRFTLYGEDRIAGRSAVKLQIQPINNDRYGYQLWLDEETGLLLRSHLMDRNRVLELFQFATIEIGADVVPSEVASSLPAQAFSHPLTPEETQVAVARPDWRAAWLPDGFRPTRTSNDRLHFTDGLATLSIFVERSTGSEPEMTTHLGGTSVITRRLKTQPVQITVVGEIPLDTAKRIAESVEPVIY